MSGNEVDRQTTLLAEVEKLLDPFLFSRGGPADFQAHIGPLDRLRRMAIKLKVFFASAVPEYLQVRFVPYFKKPVADFVNVYLNMGYVSALAIHAGTAAYMVILAALLWRNRAS